MISSIQNSKGMKPKKSEIESAAGLPAFIPGLMLTIFSFTVTYNILLNPEGHIGSKEGSSQVANGTNETQISLGEALRLFP